MHTSDQPQLFGAEEQAGLVGNNDANNDNFNEIASNNIVIPSSNTDNNDNDNQLAFLDRTNTQTK